MLLFSNYSHFVFIEKLLKSTSPDRCGSSQKDADCPSQPQFVEEDEPEAGVEEAGAEEADVEAGVEAGVSVELPLASEGLLSGFVSLFVLGHEIEHIDHYHAVERVQVEAQLKKLDLDLVGALAEIPISLWQVGYSKDEEMEADREGLRLAVAAGYSAKGAVNLLERWMKLRNEYVIHAENPTEELSQLAIDSLNGYFRTHPLPSERLAQAKEIIAQEQLPVDGPVKPIRIGYEIIADH